MRSRRIVLSDDEDGDDEARRTDSMGISTPASSTEFLRELSGLNMRSGSRTGEAPATATSQSTVSLYPTSGSKSGIAINNGEEECFGSADELDPESTIRTMQGKMLPDQSQEEADYEAMIQPIPRPGKSLDFPSPELSRTRSTERGESHRNSQNNHSHHSRSNAPRSPGRHLPRRESAVRAEQRLQSMYSEYGKQTADGRADDGDYSDGEGSTGDAQQGSNDGSDNQDTGEDEDEVGSDDFVVDDHDSDVPRHSRSKSKSRSSHSAGHSHSKAHHKGDGTSSDAAAESSRTSTRRSARSASLSSRKQQQYLRAHRDIQQKTRSGLDAVLLSSSDDEVSGQNSDEYTDYDHSHKQSTQATHDSSSRASPPLRSSQNRAGSSQRRKSHDSNSSPEAESPRRSGSHRSGGNKKGSKTQYSYSVSQMKSPAKCVGLMYRNDERGEREIDDESGSDLDDFIVNSDEERAEEEARAEEAAQRKEMRRQQRREEKARRNPHSSKHTGHKAADIVASATAEYNRQSKLSSRTQSSSSSGAGVQMNVRDDESEDGEVVHINSRHSQRSSNSGDQGVNSGRKRKVMLDSEEEEDQGYLPDESMPNKRRKSSSSTAPTSTAAGSNYTSASNGVKRGSSAQSGVIDLCNDNNAADAQHSSRRSRHEAPKAPEPDLDEESSQHSQQSGNGTEESDGSEGSDSTDASESDSDGSGSGSGSGSEDELDGPMLYHKVNSMMDKQAEKGDVSVFANMRKRFPMAEAFAYYITLLANVLVHPDFLDNCHHPGNISGHSHDHCQSQGVQSGGGVGGSGRKSKKERRLEAIQRGNYLSATRQIENLICTNRESLIGSGAWNKEFYAELQSRPFYSSVKTMMCAETKSFGMTGDSGDEESAEDKVRCAACNRETQRPDIQVFLFGSTYDARQVWNSTRWDAPLPQELFLYRLPEDEDYDGHMNDGTTGSSSGRHGRSGTPFTPAPSSAPRNKQFQAYQTILSGNIGRYGDKLTVTGASGTGSGHKLSSKLRPDEDMAETWQAQQARKRKTIVLSDSSSDEEQGGDAKRTKMCRDTQQEQEELRRIAEASARAREQQLADEQRVRAWWKQKFPRELTKEPESAFFLSYHCKNRTRLYHTLLHYKFRLLLTIREKIQRTANALAAQNGDHRTTSQFDTSWEDWDTEDRDILLRSAVEEVVQDQGFVEQETRRFETLIRETERRYGGRSEPPHDIWGDEDQYHQQHDHNSVSGSSGGNKELHMSQQTKTIVGWLAKQSKK